MMPLVIRHRTIIAMLLLLACLGCASTGPGAPAAGEPFPGARVEEEKLRLARLYLRLGETYRTALGDPVAATRSYRRCLALVTEGPEAEGARTGLELLGVNVEPASPADAEETGPLPGAPGGEGGARTEGAAPLEPARDYYGNVIEMTAGARGTMILYWHRLTPRVMELMSSMAGGGSRGEGELRLLGATDDGSHLMADFLREKGYDLPILDDTSGAIASRLGVETFPALSVIDPDGRLVRTVQGWDGTAAW